MKAKTLKKSVKNNRVSNRIVRGVKSKTSKKNSRLVSKGNKVPLIHVTDRYNLMGENAHTPSMVKRYALQNHIKSGKATIGSVLEDFGIGRNGLCRVARYVRKGLWTVKGINEVEGAKNDFDAEKSLAGKLAKLDGTKKIVPHKMPAELLKR